MGLRMKILILWGSLKYPIFKGGGAKGGRGQFADLGEA